MSESNWITLIVTLFIFIPSFLQARNGGAQQISAAYKNLLEDMQKEINDLKADMSKLKRDYRALWGYMITLVEGYVRHDITIPPIPSELESDADLIRLIKRKGKL